MTSTLSPIDTGDIHADPADTLTIRIAPYLPGTVYTAGWVPRPDAGSPDLVQPSWEDVTLADLMRRQSEQEEEFAPLAGWSAHDDAEDAETQPVIDLAAVMPAPVVEDHTPLWAQGRHRPLSHVAPWVWMALGAGVFAPAIVVVGVLLLAVTR